jgi:hypothetical protein
MVVAWRWSISFKLPTLALACHIISLYWRMGAIFVTAAWVWILEFHAATISRFSQKCKGWSLMLDWSAPGMNFHCFSDATTDCCHYIHWGIDGIKIQKLIYQLFLLFPLSIAPLQQRLNHLTMPFQLSDHSCAIPWSEIYHNRHSGLPTQYQCAPFIMSVKLLFEK